MARVLVVDDEAPLTRNLASFLGLYPREFEVATASSAEEALAVLDSFRPDVLLTDIRLPGLDGFELIRLARSRQRPMSVIVMTGTRSLDLDQKARELGITSVLFKPLNLEAVRRLIDASVQLARSQAVAEEVGA
ncbi:MAG TPA: response regulator [Thermoanaerobaculaceae bacterium]|nr:response regulator [Thermoanaerobaculaceae bacterium]HRS16613.1 response regulator [Thermoanaerobaculaceae bacterium]